MIRFIFTALIILPIITGCAKLENPRMREFKIGKNVVKTTVDGIQREYIVSVPIGYDGETKFPVVFMLHGTNGDGEKFYDVSGWKELGELENILTVFPSSLRYCINIDGEQKSPSKWNSLPDNKWEYCSGVTPPNDIKFLGQVIDELDQKYNIDEKRVYFIGFSNGGQMCAKLSIFMSDRIAAIVESGGSFNIDTTYSPKRNLPISYFLGNGDYGPGVIGPFLPLGDLENLLGVEGRTPHTVSQTHIKSFSLEPTYTISGDTNTVAIATFTPKNGMIENNFNFAFVKGLDHHYPNGTNHWLNGPRVQWTWLKDFTLP